MKRLVVVLVLLWPVAGMAGAGFHTGNQLQEWCVGTYMGEPNFSVAKYNQCVAYLAGISDSAKALSAWGYRNNGIAPTGSCIPKGVTVEQLRAAWLKYASKQPENLHLAASTQVLAAIYEAWPCKR